jgi:hypothetical protein
MSDKDIEQEIQAKGKTAPRITPDHIESVISKCHFINAGKSLRAVWPVPEMADHVSPVLNLLTICVLVLKNGFTVTGESACASPDNFDVEIGRKIARDNAVQKVWALEGYLLKQKLYVAGERGMMIEYVQDSIKEGYKPYYGLPEKCLAWLSDECLKIEYDLAVEYYAPGPDGKSPQRGVGE